MLSFRTRSWRSANFASAFRSDPCFCTARSYSGPNFCRRLAVVLLRFRTYTQASTTMTRIPTAASTINSDLTDLDSSKPSLVSNAHKTTLVHQRLALAVRDLINQMKTSADPNYCQRVTANDGELATNTCETFRTTRRPSRRS